MDTLVHAGAASLPKPGERMKSSIGPYTRVDVLAHTKFTGDWNSIHREPEAAYAWCVACNADLPRDGAVIVPGGMILASLTCLLLTKLGDGASPVRIDISHSHPVFTGESVDLDIHFPQVLLRGRKALLRVEGWFYLGDHGERKKVGEARASIVKPLNKLC